MVQPILPHHHHHCHRHCPHPCPHRPGMLMALVALEHEPFDLLQDEERSASVRLEAVQDLPEALSLPQ